MAVTPPLEEVSIDHADKEQVIVDEASDVPQSSSPSDMLDKEKYMPFPADSPSQDTGKHQDHCVSVIYFYLVQIAAVLGLYESCGTRQQMSKRYAPLCDVPLCFMYYATNRSAASHMTQAIQVAQS